jgi:hypothetical protein
VPSEYAPPFEAYVSLVPETDVLAVLESQVDEVRRVARSVTGERETFRYAPGKWSIREILGHIGDGERVFGYRAFCISRGDQSPLPGFEENDYIAAADYDRHAAAVLAEDFAAVRTSNLAVLGRLPAETWANVGTANNSRISLRAIAYVMAGHFRHHMGVLRSRYDVGA